MRKIFIKLLLAFGLALAGLLVTSGRSLVLDAPKPADVIVVLAGETELRPLRGLQLLKQNVAPRLIMDVPARAEVYGHSETQLAEEYEDQISKISSVERKAIEICPVFGLSTKAEVTDVKNCLQGRGVSRVLLVTSEFHSRRALSTFAHQAPSFNFSVASAFDERHFSPRWWSKREWAKTNLDEWLRLMWWELADRWL